MVGPPDWEVRLHSADDERADDPDEAGLIHIEAWPSSVGYRDMEDFISLVPDRRAREVLSGAIAGRGAFRRFKDTLFEFPDLRQEWFAFRERRARRHAIDWLEEKGLVSAEKALAAAAKDSDPAVGAPIADLARQVSLDLREMYGPRLVDVLVFGSRARRDATRDSALDLLVVLDDVEDPWAEQRTMEETLWRHTAASGVVVTALPVSRRRFESPDAPLLVRARVEAVPA